MRQVGVFVSLALIAALAGATPARAQWIQRTYELGPGWNSVYLEIDPAPAEADELFQGLPVTSVWMPRPRRAVDGPAVCANPDDDACVPPAESEWWVLVSTRASGATCYHTQADQGGT